MSDWISVEEDLPAYPSTVLGAYESDDDGRPCLDVGEVILMPDGKWYGMGIFYCINQKIKFEPRICEKKVVLWKHKGESPEE